MRAEDVSHETKELPQVGSKGVIGVRRLKEPMIAPLEELIKISWHMIPRGGALLAIKGETAEAELAATSLKKGSIAQVHEISLPNLPVARVVEVRKGA